MARRSVRLVEVVGPNTHVALAAKGGETLEYTVYEELPVDPNRCELLLSDANTLGLIGKKVGEEVVWNEGSWNEKRLVVTEIKSALDHVVADTMKNYEERFPGQPFLHGFRAPDGTRVDEWMPIIATVEKRKNQRKQVFEIYRAQIFPLGWVAHWLQIDIPTVMAQITSGEEKETRILVELPEATSQGAAVQAAVRASSIVLSRSALETALRLEIHELVRSEYTIVAPRTMLRELNAEAREAERLVAEGTASIGGGDRGLVFYQLEPGAEALLENARRRREVLEWCRAHVEFRARPLSMFTKANSHEDELREAVGRESWDALELAAERQIPIWADDLGLRRIGPGGKQADSFSTVGLLVALTRKGKLTEDACCRMFHTLILQRYSFVPVSPVVLLSALTRYHELGRTAVVEIFAAIAALPNVTQAARLLARVLRDLAILPILPVSVESAAILGLEAGARRWPRQLVAKQVHDASFGELALLPQILRTVQKTCAQFARGLPEGKPVV